MRDRKRTFVRCRRLSLAAILFIACTAPGTCSIVGSAMPGSIGAWVDRLEKAPNTDHPPIDMSHFTIARGGPTENITGLLRFTSAVFGHPTPARQVDVYLLPADDYTAWFAARVAMAHLFSDGGPEPRLDAGVVNCCVRFGVTDAEGELSFENVPVGTYYVMAILRFDVGDLGQHETSISGWDGNGHNVAVTVPNGAISGPSATFETFVFAREITLQAGYTDFGMGVVKPNVYLIDGHLRRPM